MGSALSARRPAMPPRGSSPTAYGFWPIDIEDIKEQVRERGVVVSDLSEVPPRFNGEILLINDHGNASLYVLARKKLKLIWSIV
jgi:hypothetical protein